METACPKAIHLSRILIVSAGPFSSQIGGGQSYVQDLVVGYSGRGHAVTVLEPVRPGQGVAVGPNLWQGIAVYPVALPLPGETLEEQSTELGETRIALFCEILRKIDPDVVHINGLMPTMVQACRHLGVRHVVVAHHPGEVCPKGDLLRPDDSICTLVPSPEVCGACVLRCKKGGAGIGNLLALLPSTVHRILGKALVRRNPLGYVGRVLYIPWLVEQRLLGLQAYQRDAQAIIAPSRAIAVALVRAGVQADRVRVIHHGIHPVTCPPIDDLGQRLLRFAFVGRIDHAKGVHVLLRAMQQAGIEGRAELHLYGEATRSQDQAAWQTALGSVGQPAWLHLHGKFPRHKVAEIYSAIDILVLPAIYLEIFGLVVAEALSAGRPVLTTACGGPAEQVVDGVNGWIVAPNDVDALARKIRQLVDYPSQVEEAATATTVSFKTHAQYLDEMEEVLSGKSGKQCDRK